MPFLDWLRRRPEGAVKVAVPRRATPAAPVRALPAPVDELPVDARALVPGWRPAEGRLVVELTEPVGPGRRVALRLVGEVGVTAPLFGTVRSARGTGARCTAEIEVDPERRPALFRVLDFLHGRAPMPRQRAPRFRVRLPAVISVGASHHYMQTTSLSLTGCALAWTGPRPFPGAIVNARIGGQERAATLRGRICWVRAEAAGARVGVRFLVGGDQAALAAILAEIRDPAAET